MKKEIVTGLMTLSLFLLSPLVVGAVETDTEGNTIFNAPVNKSDMPKGSYMFTKANTLESKGGKADSKLFSKIVKGKHNDIIADMDKKIADGMESTAIDGSLESSLGSLWDYDLNKLYTNASSSTFTVNYSGTKTTIYVPLGRMGSTQVNKGSITATINAIKLYKRAVREGVLVSSLANSLNVYTFYPEKATPLLDLVDEDMKDGKKLETYSLKTSGKMKYSLDKFYNPLFGELTAKEIKGGEETQTYWSSQIAKVPLKSEGGKLSYTPNADFKGFIESVKKISTLADVKDSVVAKNSTGVTTYKSSITGKAVKPKNKVDTALVLAVPRAFSKSMDDSERYSLANSKGYSLLGGYRAIITNRYVVKKTEDEYSPEGDFNDFGLDPKGLMVYYVNLDKDDKVSKEGRPVGALIPLWYKEAVVKAGEGGSISDEDFFYTGRTIKLANDYSSKMNIDVENRDIMAADTKLTGKVAVVPRDFAFLVGSKLSESQSHFNLEVSPPSFEFKIGLKNKGDIKGLFIYRNNYYVNSKSLVDWLETEEAQAMTEVDAEKLLELIQGGMESTKKNLTYAEWVRMQEIRNELDVSLQSKVTSAMHVFMMLFGMFIIFYVVFMMLAYLIDIFNVFMETSLLMLMSMNRLYPVPPSEKEYISSMPSENGAKYVTFWYMFVIMSIGILIGCLFIYGDWVINMVSFLYFKISGWLGGF